MQTIDIKHDGIGIIIMTIPVSAVMLAAAIFGNTIDPETRKWAALTGIIFLFLSILFFSRRKHTVITLTPKGIILPISPTTIIPWHAIQNYKLHELVYGPITINSTIQIYLDPSYIYITEHTRKYGVIYRAKKIVFLFQVLHLVLPWKKSKILFPSTCKSIRLAHLLYNRALKTKR